MDEQKDTFQQSLLDMDLDAVVAEGKKRQKKTVIISVVLVVAIIIASMVGFIAYRATAREATYKKAVAAQEAEDYETAISLYQKLGNYKNSAENLACCNDEIQLVKTFLDSSVYRRNANGAKEFADTLGWSDSITFDKKEQKFIVTYVVTEFEMWILDDISSPSMRSVWDTICDALADLSGDTTKEFSDEGYPFGCTILLRAKDTEELLYSTTNGNVDFNCVDA